jgi:hypothetical protein
MNQKYNTFDNDFSAVSLKNFESYNLSEKNLFFQFLVINTSIVLFILLTALYPIKYFKKLIEKFFNIHFFIKNTQIKIYHILFLIIGIYIYLYMKLKLSLENIIPDKNETYHKRMKRLNKIKVLESEIWMVFIIIICFISIYRNANLFNKEIQINEKIKEIGDKIKQKRQKK